MMATDARRAHATLSPLDGEPPVDAQQPQQRGHCVHKPLSWTRQLHQLIEMLKRLAQESPHSFKPEGLELRPCLMLTIVGTKGSGKSTAINAIVSMLRGRNAIVTMTAEGTESTVGTLATTPYPLHNDLWAGQPQPPAYVYLVDTRGLDATEITDMGAASGVFQALLDGSLKVGAKDLWETGSALEEQDVCLPPPMCVLYNISLDDLQGDDRTAHVLRLFTKLVHRHNAQRGNRPVTFVVMVSKTDNAGLLEEEEKRASDSGFHERRLLSAALRRQAKGDAARAGVDADLLHFISGLDTVDAFSATNGPDVGEHAVRLVALLRALVCGIVSGRQAHHDFAMREGARVSVACAATESKATGDGRPIAETLRTLRDASPSEVERLIRSAAATRRLAEATDGRAKRVLDSLESACSVVRENLLSGGDLLEQSDAELVALFAGCCVGVQHAILDLVADAR